MSTEMGLIELWSQGDWGGRCLRNAIDDSTTRV